MDNLDSSKKQLTIDRNSKIRSLVKHGNTIALKRAYLKPMVSDMKTELVNFNKHSRTLKPSILNHKTQPFVVIKKINANSLCTLIQDYVFTSEYSHCVPNPSEKPLHITKKPVISISVKNNLLKPGLLSSSVPKPGIVRGSIMMLKSDSKAPIEEDSKHYISNIKKSSEFLANQSKPFILKHEIISLPKIKCSFQEVSFFY